MARIDTLTNFLTDVASAIKTKKGDNTPIPASNFDTEIDNIQTIIDGYTFSSLYTGNTSTSQTTSDTNKYKILTNAIVKEIPKMELDFTNCTMLNYAFVWCYGLEKIDVSEWDVSTITNFRGMFYGCENLKEIDFSNWTTSSSITAINLIFKRCSSLKKANLSCFNGAFNIGELFNGCTSLEFIDIRGLDLVNSTYQSSFLGVGQGSVGAVPQNCEIIVADQTQKDYMTTNFPDYTNVKTVAEYEAS